MKKLLSTLWLVVSAALFASPASSTERIGDWAITVDRDSAGKVLSTSGTVVSPNENVLVFLCEIDTGLCGWKIYVSQQCTPGNKYPILVNFSSTGPRHVEALCVIGSIDSRGRKYGAFDLQHSFIELYEGATNFGVALVTARDTFDLTYFSTIGIDDMVQRVASTAATISGDKQPPQKRQSNRNKIYSI
jgi:hypothetical protein